MGWGATASTALTCLDPVGTAMACYYFRGVEDTALLRSDQQKFKSEIMSLHYQ